MKTISSKFFSYYLIFGSLVHTSYGLFIYYFIGETAEPFWQRLSLSFLAIIGAAIFLIAQTQAKISEFFAYFIGYAFTLHSLYLIHITPQPEFYLQGLMLMLAGVSAVIFRRSFLYFYFASTLPFAIAVVYQLAFPYPVGLQIFCISFAYLLILVFNYLKIMLLEGLELAWENEAEHIKTLENSYKANLQAAHDLGSPISAIKMVGHQIKSSHEKIYELLKSSTEQLQDISSQLLIDHRNQKDQLEIDFFDLENNLSQIITNKRHELKGIPNLFIMYRFHSPLVRPVRVAKSEFYRVLSNIINNSVEATLENDQRRINVIVEPEKDHVAVLVSDNGCGISEDIRNSIFEEHFTTKEMATGIGLSLSKSIVQKWRGRIYIKNTGVKGSTIAIEIPYD